MIPSIEREDAMRNAVADVMGNVRTVTVSRGEVLERVFLLRDSSCELPMEHLVLEAGSRADVTVIVMPGVSCDIRLAVDIAGENADCSVKGIYLCPDNEKVHVAVDMNHLVPRCSSRQLFKGIAGGSSSVDFYGKIIVASDAQKTEAYQENHSLLLSDRSSVNTRPQLEIYADDVKCSHGATIGRLNEEEQFYMRSRGITLREARVLQMISFLSPVFHGMPESAVREAIEEAVETAVRQM